MNFKALLVGSLLFTSLVVSGTSEEIALIGQLEFGAPTNWSPPTNFILEMDEWSVWVDLESNGLSGQGRRLATENITVLVQGKYNSESADAVFIATSIERYVRKPTAPTAAQCELVRDRMLERYQRGSNGTNGVGIGQGSDGECTVVVFFPNEEAQETFISDRQEQGLSTNEEVLDQAGKVTKVGLKLEVIGDIFAFSIGGNNN